MTFGHSVGGTNPIVAQSPIVADWQQLSGCEVGRNFGGELFAQSRVAQERAETLTEWFEQNVSPSQQSQPVLRTLLNRILHWFDPEKDLALVGRSFSLTSKSSCATGLTLGTVGSLFTQHPLPMLLGLSSCFPSAQAQQKVGGEFKVNNYTANDQAFPGVASFPDGDFVVIWSSMNQDGSNWGIYGQLFGENGNKIGDEFQINTYTTDRQYALSDSITTFSNNNFVVIWQSNLQDGSSWGVYGQIFNGTGTKIGNEFQVNTFTTNDQAVPSVAGLSNNKFVVTWHSFGQDASGHGIFGQVFNETGTKIGSEFQINTYESGAQRYPSVADLNNDSFAVVWESVGQDGFGSGIFGQLLDGSGNKAGSEFRVNSYAIDQQWWPSVEGLRNGNFIVTWASNWQDGDLIGVFGRLFNDQGKKIGREIQVNTEFVNDQAFPFVKSLNNGHFVVVWGSRGQEGLSWGVFGQLFDENCFKIGNEFQVNNFTIGDQGGPSAVGDQGGASVASLQNGNFIVTWHSENQDGSGYGVYGQIFHDNWTLSSNLSSTSTSQTTTTTSSSMTTTSIVTTSSSSSIVRSIIRTTNLITTDRIPVTSDSTSKIPSTSPPRNNVLAWFAFFLGGAACVASLVHAGYSFYKSKRREEKGNTVELGERRSPGGAPALEFGTNNRADATEEHYQRTPDHVHPF